MKIRYPVEYSRQLQQWLDSYLRVFGHEPSAEEIEAFEERHRIKPRPLVAA